MATYLDRILDEHREAAATDDRRLDDVLDQARTIPAPRGFAAALRATAATELAVVAEIKRRSPSKGDLAPDVDPATMASSYERGGAACLSVLTDQTWFGGNPADLAAARAAVAVPVLRKDFTISPLDVADTRHIGADAVLLIVAALAQAELAELHALALDLGLDVLVEVHDEHELDSALAAGASLIGVNQRDLVTFEVDTERALRVGAAMPQDVLRVAESGIRGRDDAARLDDAGFHAVLVGESVVTAGDPADSVTALRVPRR